MRPYQHARSSALQAGRSWQDDLSVHEFIDSSKVAFPDLRHRMILHSVDLGAELTARAFPGRADARDLARRHVIEDLGQPRTLQDWLSHCRIDRLPKLHPEAIPLDVAKLVEVERARQRIADSTHIKNVLELLQLPMTFAPNYGLSALAILCNSFGLGIVRAILGAPREVAGEQRSVTIFDPSLCAEAIVYRLFRTIPDLRSVVTTLRASHQMESSHDPIDRRPNASVAGSRT